MQNGKIAVPTNNPGGLTAQRSDHFGHCESYTIISIAGGVIAGVEAVRNQGHEAGGCMVPVRNLSQLGVNAIIVGGIGGGPLRGFANEGIDVFFAAKDSYGDVQSVVDGLMQSKLNLMEPSQACKGSGNCHGH